MQTAAQREGTYEKEVESHGQQKEKKKSNHSAKRRGGRGSQTIFEELIAGNCRTDERYQSIDFF